MGLTDYVSTFAALEDGDANDRARAVVASLGDQAKDAICFTLGGALGEADANALTSAGARAIPVTDALCISAKFVSAVIAAGGAPPAAPRLRIVVPMAGLGSRFANDGFVIQKPFLPTIGGAQLWELVLENLMPKEEPLRSQTEAHLVVRADQLEYFRKVPHVTLHTVPGLTEGPACTVLTLKDIINDDTPLMIGNSDQFLEWDSDAFYAAAFHPDFDGAISTFYHPRPDDLKWSYARLAVDGSVEHVAEKVYVGPWATTGLYAFKKGSDFVTAAEDMIAKNERVNNEFYCCPSYNNAMRAGKRYRVVNCAKFWGVGVPVDYAAFLDKYVPPGPPLPFRAALSRRYAAMRCKWAPRLPVPQPDVASDPTLCAAMWSTGAFSLTPNYYKLREALAPWAHAAQWYEPQEGLGLAQQGAAAKPASFAAAAATPRAVMHHTFFQFRTFPVAPADAQDESGLGGDLKKWAAAAQASMADLPPYYLSLRGAVPVRSGIVATGFPPTDYLSVREAIRSAAPCREPHAQDIHHVTLLRWTSALSADDTRAVAAICERFADEPLGSFQPSMWHVGLATWSVRPETVTPVVSWRAPPSPWVLHRGNIAGLTPSTENDPAVLKQRLAGGWDIEIDLWRCSATEAAALASAAASHAASAGPDDRAAALANFSTAISAQVAKMTPASLTRPSLWLGHDAPAFQLSPDDIDGLLAAPGVWIHAKHLASFAWLRAHPRSADFNFFSHDKDEVALSSQGFAWGYPGIHVPGPATVSVVWPKDKHVTIGPGVGVCWDWLPKDVNVEFA